MPYPSRPISRSYDLDIANLGRIRQRVISDSRISAEKLKPLLEHIDYLMVELRPFLKDIQSKPDEAIVSAVPPIRQRRTR